MVTCTWTKLVPAKAAHLCLGFVPVKVPHYPLTCMWPVGMNKVMGCTMALLALQVLHSPRAGAVLC